MYRISRPLVHSRPRYGISVSWRLHNTAWHNGCVMDTTLHGSRPAHLEPSFIFATLPRFGMGEWFHGQHGSSRGSSCVETVLVEGPGRRRRYRRPTTWSAAPRTSTRADVREHGARLKRVPCSIYKQYSSSAAAYDGASPADGARQPRFSHHCKQHRLVARVRPFFDKNHRSHFGHLTN